MPPRWSSLIKQYRLRNRLTQERLGLLLGVSQRTVSRWERGEDMPRPAQQRRLRDLAAVPFDHMVQSLRLSIEHCPAPRALSVYENLRLLSVSPPAIAKRPSIVNWIGSDLRPLACGVLAEMRDDAALQRDIAKGEVLGISAITEGVLRMPPDSVGGKLQTAIAYFWVDDALFSDAISMPAPPSSKLGYTALHLDEVAGR